MSTLRVKEKMKERGIGNKALSELSGISLGTLNKIIYGETTSPSVDNVMAIAKALGCSVNDLIEEEKEEYYFDSEVAKKAQEIYEDSGSRILLDAKRDLSKEDLDTIVNMIKRFKDD